MADPRKSGLSKQRITFEVSPPPPPPSPPVRPRTDAGRALPRSSKAVLHLPFLSR